MRRHGGALSKWSTSSVTSSGLPTWGDARQRAGTDESRGTSRSVAQGPTAFRGLTSLRDPPSANSIDRLPALANEVRAPWAVRLTEDERHYFYLNVDTREMRWDLPAQAVDSKLDPNRRPSAITLDSEMSSDAEAILTPSETAHSLPGRSATQALGSRLRAGSVKSAAAPFNALTNAGNKSLMRPTNALSPPAALQQETELSDELQRRMHNDDSSILALARLQSTLAKSLGRIMTIIAEYGSRAKTGSDAVGVDMLVAMEDAVAATRALLFAAGATSMMPEDLETVASSSRAVNSLGGLPGEAISGTGGHIGPVHRGSSNGAASKYTVPALTSPSIIVPSRKVAQSLSKLILSTRTLVELNRLDAAPVSGDQEYSTVLVYRAEQRRQRVREDATDLLRAARALSAELDHLRPAAAQVGSTAPWPRRLEPYLNGGEGAGGINPFSPGGGSAAGWRGNGFMLPTPAETSALRADTMGFFTNPFDLTKELSNALQTGRTALRRRPTQPLASSVILTAIQPQHDALQTQIASFKALLTGKTEDAGALSADSLLEAAKGVLDRSGGYLSLLEELDLAVVLDLDGAASDSEDTDAMRLVESARATLREFSNGKQSLYDHSSDVLAVSQDAVSASFDDDFPKERAAEVAEILEHVQLDVDAVQQTLAKLADISARQQKQGSAKIGARAKVYGVVDLTLPAKSGPVVAEAHEAPKDTGGLLYLGPGIAVPDGPEDFVPRTAAGRLNVMNRARSGSSATTGSGSALRSVQEDASGESLDDLDQVRSARSDKARRIFGDEPTEMDAAVKRAEADPWFLEGDYSSNEIVMTSEGQVKGATLPALMERLTMHNSYGEPVYDTALRSKRTEC